MNPEYTAAECVEGHLLEWVAEGYAICSGSPDAWTPWSITDPRSDYWSTFYLRGRDGNEIEAWLTFDTRTREEALAVITKHAALIRSLPFDEDVERARLMPV